MSTTARQLLNIMSVRLSMLESSTTNADQVVALATKQLVERLALLAPDEPVEVTYTVNPLHVKYLRQSSGEVLAEWQKTGDA